jgi:hypothetical protein
VFSHFSVLCGQLLCFFHDHDDFLASKAATSPIIIFKAHCEKAENYTKRKHVFRWCVWIVWLLAVCWSIKSGYFHLFQHLMLASDSHCYCADCVMPQAAGTSLSPRRPELDPRPGHVRFIVESDTVTSLSPCTWFSHVSVVAAVLHNHLYLYTVLIRWLSRQSLGNFEQCSAFVILQSVGQWSSFTMLVSCVLCVRCMHLVIKQFL